MGAHRQPRSGRGMGPRRFCVHPAIMRGPGERIEGIGILAESSGHLGLLLWQTARDVMLWGETPPDQRCNLFADGSGDVRAARRAETDLPSAISASVDSIHGMLTLGSRPDAGVLSLCCLEVAAWAHKAGLSETAVTFAQAGAVAPLICFSKASAGIRRTPTHDLMLCSLQPDCADNPCSSRTDDPKTFRL